MTTFTCQKCHSPLKVDESLRNLNPASFDLLAGLNPDSTVLGTEGKTSSISSDRKSMYENAKDESSSALFRQGTPSARRGIAPVSSRHGLKGQPDMSFVVLTESLLQPLHSTTQSMGKDARNHDINAQPSDIPHEAFSQKIEYHNRLFEILSARSDVDHPVCVDCSDVLLSQFQSRLSAATKERDAFAGFLKDLKTKAPSTEEVSRAKQELETAQADEEEAFQNLVRKEREKEELERELAELEEEELVLQRDEEAFWKSRNGLQQEILKQQRNRDALAAAYNHDEDQLGRLRKTNVFNDTFSVGHDGSFGTINGLRLGRLPPNFYVEWAEINAAWGLAALLLTTVAEKLGFTFHGYKMRPMGSTTKIDRVEKVSASDGRPKITSLDLFSSGDLPIAKGIMHRRFNEAMVAFLDCMNQLEQFIVGRNNGTHNFALMYTIDKDTINGVSIRLGQSNDTHWTQACKYTLTNCKLLLAHTSSVETSRPAS